MSLLNKVLGVPGVTQCLSAKVLWVPECPSSAPVPRVLKCPSAIGVPLEYPFSAVPNFPLSTRRVKKNCKIARNGLVNSFIEILKTFQNTNFYITLQGGRGGGGGLSRKTTRHLATQKTLVD